MCFVLVWVFRCDAWLVLVFGVHLDVHVFPCVSLRASLQSHQIVICLSWFGKCSLGKNAKPRTSAVVKCWSVLRNASYRFCCYLLNCPDSVLLGFVFSSMVFGSNATACPQRLAKRIPIAKFVVPIRARKKRSSSVQCCFLLFRYIKIKEYRVRGAHQSRNNGFWVFWSLT